MSNAKKKRSSAPKVELQIRCMVYLYREQHAYIHKKAAEEYISASSYVRRLIKNEMEGKKGKNGG